MFFSVRYPVKIGGKLHIPCVCYELTRNLEKTVDKLVSEDVAIVHTKMVYFQNGKPVEKKTIKTEKPVKTVKTETKKK